MEVAATQAWSDKAVSLKMRNRNWSSQGRDGLPHQLKAVQGPRMEFDNARDPSLRAQREAMKNTEAKRREEQGKGSKMVKLHKPFPDLRPKSQLAHENLRQSFNKQWLAEQKHAVRNQRSKDIFDRIDQGKADRSFSRARKLGKGIER